MNQDDPKSEHDPRKDEPEDLPSGNEILGTLFEEASLWPLLTVILGSLGAIGGAMLVLAIGDRNPFAAGALLLAVAMTTDVAIRSRRRPELRNIAKMLGLLWLAATLFALLATYFGIT